MKVYDISLPVQPGMVTWPSHPPVTLQRFRKIEEGERCNVSRLEMCTHAGTHVDAPYHFLKDGNTVEQLSLDDLVGPAQVVVFPDHVDVIDAQLLEAAGIPPGTERLLCKTRNSGLWARKEPAFDTRFVALGADAADWLIANGIRLIGVDYLSVATYGEVGGSTHLALLGASVVIIEGLDLSGVDPGSYTLVCLPLKLVGSDGAPARAVLTTAQICP
jgi:arylformamidase